MPEGSRGRGVARGQGAKGPRGQGAKKNICGCAMDGRQTSHSIYEVRYLRIPRPPPPLLASLAPWRLGVDWRWRLGALARWRPWRFGVHEAGLAFQPGLGVGVLALAFWRWRPRREPPCAWRWRFGVGVLNLIRLTAANRARTPPPPRVTPAKFCRARWATAMPIAPPRARWTVSWAKVEKVVNAPRKPVRRISRVVGGVAYGCRSRRRSARRQGSPAR